MRKHSDENRGVFLLIFSPRVFLYTEQTIIYQESVIMDFFGISLPELITVIGLAGVCFIVFAETGLFLGFFLPGDSLLFVAGVLASQDIFSLPILLASVLISALLGNFAGY